MGPVVLSGLTFVNFQLNKNDTTKISYEAFYQMDEKQGNCPLSHLQMYRSEFLQWGVRRASGGVHYGPAVHAVIVPAVAVHGLQAGFGRHQSPGHRAAVTSVLHHRLQLVVLRLRHEVVDGEWVVEGVVGVVGVRFQVRGLVQQQRVRVVREQVLRVCGRGGHAHGA